MKKLFRILVYMLPAVLFFSYYPIISFGANETMNFELSLPLIWLVAFAILSFALVVKEKKFGEVFKGWPFLLLPAFLTLTILWSENRTRGILTAGIFWLIYIAGFSIYIFRDYFKGEKFRRIFWKWFFASALFVCAWCFLQCVLDLVGVSREYSLMCAGCTYKSFGFPHPNGFAIEPQFMGNLLLAPAIMSIWFLAKDESNSTSRGRVARARRHGARALILGRNLRKPLKVLLPFIFITTLFLTFSRGAIYAFGVAMIFMTAYLWVREKKLMKKVMVGWGVTIAAFLFTLNVQGIMAQVSPTNDTYWSGVSKVLNHLSLGIIDVRKANAVEEEAVISEAAFDGYVAESTEIRKMLTRNALAVWQRDFKTMMFGVGIGGAGEAMFRVGVMDSPKEIVQNQYANLLLETGIVGVLFVIFTFWLVLRFIIKNSQVGLILTLIVAYGVSLVFFAGLPNALHIYLLVPVLMVFFDKKRLQ